MRKLLMPVLAALAVVGCGGSSASHASGHKVGACAVGYATPYGCSAHSPTFGLPPKNPALRPTALPPLTATPTVLQLDTTDNSFSGLVPQAAAGYTSGHWPTYFWMLTRYRGLNAIGRVVSINVGAGHHGKCLDVEPGDASAWESSGWVRRDFAAGFQRPCVYANLSTMPAVRANLRSGGLHHCSSTGTHCYLLWDANWTRRDHLDAGYDCTQWDNSYRGRNSDPSRCAVTFYRASVRPKPKPKPKPKPGPWGRQFNAGYARGYTVHWLRKHHRRVPPTRLRFTSVVRYGYGIGYRRVH